MGRSCNKGTSVANTCPTPYKQAVEAERMGGQVNNKQQFIIQWQICNETLSLCEWQYAWCTQQTCALCSDYNNDNDNTDIAGHNTRQGPR